MRIKEYSIEIKCLRKESLLLKYANEFLSKEIKEETQEIIKFTTKFNVEKYQQLQGQVNKIKVNREEINRIFSIFELIIPEIKILVKKKLKNRAQVDWKDIKSEQFAVEIDIQEQIMELWKNRDVINELNILESGMKEVLNGIKDIFNFLCSILQRQIKVLAKQSNTKFILKKNKRHSSLISPLGFSLNNHSNYSGIKSISSLDQMSTLISSKEQKSQDSRYIQTFLSEKVNKNILIPFNKAQKPKPKRIAQGYQQSLHQLNLINRQLHRIDSNKSLTMKTSQIRKCKSQSKFYQDSVKFGLNKEMPYTIEKNQYNNIFFEKEGNQTCNEEQILEAIQTVQQEITRSLSSESQNKLNDTFEIQISMIEGVKGEVTAQIDRFKKQSTNVRKKSMCGLSCY